MPPCALKSPAYYDALNDARDLRFSTSSDVRVIFTSGPVAPEHSINPFEPHSRSGRPRKRGLSGPEGICEHTGSKHRTTNGDPGRLRCRDCKANWRAE